MPKMSSAFYIDNQRKQAAPVDEEVVDDADVDSSPPKKASKVYSSPVHQFWRVERDSENKKKYVCNLDEAAGFKTVMRLADTKSTSPLWDYLQKKHPTEHALIAHLKKGASKKTNEDAFYAFKNPKAVSVNLRLLDLIQSRALPLNLGEDPTLRAFASELEPRIKLVSREGQYC